MDLFQIISSTLELLSISTLCLVVISYGIFKVKDKRKEKGSTEKSPFFEKIEQLSSKKDDTGPIKKTEGKFKKIEPENLIENEHEPSTQKGSYSKSKFQVYNNFSELSSINFK